MTSKYIEYKPLLTNYNKIIKYLKLIDKNRYYSNFGPLYYECNKLIKKRFNLKKQTTVFTSSAHSSILASLYLIKNLTKKRYVLTSSYNFFSSPQAIIQAGFEPVFIDINIKDLQFNDNDLINLPKKILRNIACIIIPSPHGMPIDVFKLNKIRKKNKCEIIYDAADTFNNFNKDLNKADFFISCSFHPTKNFGANESGLIICNKKYKKKLETIISFGADFERKNANLIGFNGKFSEYDAAIFLANYFENSKFEKKLKKNSIYFRRKFLELNKKDIFLQSGFGINWFGSKACLISTKKNYNNFYQEFIKFKIKIFHPWSSKPMNYQKNFKNIKKTNLNVTKKYTNKIFALPLNKDLEKKDINKFIFAISKIFD
ncbi:aminotransferase class V-fold PLP-dependent enzyme [Candidatus Pelagibacter sp.]|uniref:aminotransferase class V-fold PLP-dependent enzyme n=1 Tax=Candidatus Pelagibacter sp. TaxID=2024849 RepID=UPI003F830E24